MSADPRPGGPLDSDHLDEDPEALEDPVHSGDARHQHDLHHPTAKAAEPDAAEAPPSGDDADQDG